MTATDELRRMLDERGARWTACSKAAIDNQTFCRGHTYTEFQAGLMVSDLTPEQAIEATLGRGTCKSVDKTDPAVWFVCSECGYGRDGIEFVPRYCPNCGRRVVAGDA